MEPELVFPAAPPWTAFRARLLERADAMAAAGDAAGAAVLRATIESWWREQITWDRAAHETLRAAHEINNALVGVSGNVQLLLLSESGRQPALRERLEVVLREAERIGRAVHTIGTLKAALAAANPPARRGENDAADAHAA